MERKYYNQPNKFRSREIIKKKRARKEIEREQRYQWLQPFLEVDKFVMEVIGPWATQARISQIIAEDYKNMEGNYNKLKKDIKEDLKKDLDDALDNDLENYFVEGLEEENLEALKNLFKEEYYEEALGLILKHVVEVSLSKTNNEFVQIAPGINHGFVEQSTSENETFVRLYVTVFKEAVMKTNEQTGEKTTDYKDIHQDSEGNIVIYTGKEPILWVNAGQPLRALKWLEKYKVQDKNARPLIRSFCLPVSDYLKISKNVILEKDAGKIGNKNLSFNVDQFYASDQFGIRGIGLEILKAKAVRDSLKTYIDTDNYQYINRNISGKLLLTSKLKEDLGVPVKNIDGANVWVNPKRSDFEGGDFVKMENFKGLANKLMNIYGIWTNKNELISKKIKEIPNPMRRFEIMRKDLKEYKIDISDEIWNKLAGLMGNNRSPTQVAQLIREGNLY